jgi:rfaE bifunctional protein kinase chain/domain
MVAQPSFSMLLSGSNFRCGNMVMLPSLASLRLEKPLVVAGDLFLDAYTLGEALKISPEAPVPVLRVKERRFLAGGAGNVALGVESLHASVKIVGRVGNDEAALRLLRSLGAKGVDTSFVFQEPDYSTIVKNRVIAEGQQIVRIDEEEIALLSASFEKEIIAQIPAILEECSALLLSDYGKGFFTKTLLQAFIQEARLRKIPVIADPKGIDFTRYKGADILKPNRKEAYEAAALSDAVPLETVAQELIRTCGVEHILITQAEQGMTLFSKRQRPYRAEAEKREVRDVTGAGDTVLAVMGVAVAAGLSLEESVQLANTAGGIAVEHFGCYQVSLADLAARLLRLQGDNKIYSESQAWAVKQTLKNRQVTLLAVDAKLNEQLFKTIEEAAHPERDLIVYVRTDSPSESFVRFLSSLPQVRYVVLQQKALQELREILSEHTLVLEGIE